MPEAFYRNLHRHMETHPRQRAAVVFFSKYLPLLVYTLYPMLLLCLFLLAPELLATAIVYPAVGFVTVTCLRAGLNLPRPYEVMDLPPIIPKETAGKSFPSRHCACAAVIAVTALKLLPPLGVVLSILAVAIALTRVLSGVHFIRDAVAGLLLGAAIGIIGCFL